MSDPTQPPADLTNSNPASSDPTSPTPSGASVPPAYQAPAGPAYPSYPAPGAPEVPVYGQPATYGQAPAYGQNPYGQQNPQDKYNVLSIISLVASILFISIVGIITGHIALNQIKKTGEKGHGLALWGTILGYVGLFGTAIITFALIVWAFTAASVGSSYYN
jgi:hypothetical protein